MVDYYPTKRTYRVPNATKRGNEHDVEDENDDEDDSDAHVGVELEKQKDDKTISMDKHLADELNHGDTDLPKFSPRAVPGIFLGYRLSPGGVWKGA